MEMIVVVKLDDLDKKLALFWKKNFFFINSLLH